MAKTQIKKRPEGVSKRQWENLQMKPKGALEPKAAIEALKKFKAPKFDQTVNICMTLSIDPKQADQGIRGAVAMPKGIGKSKRVIAFVSTPDAAKEAMAAGAVKAGGEDLVDEVEKGFFEFDVAVASPDMMRVVSKLGRVLGPKGLMPSPKAGTVTPQVGQAVREYAAGKVEYRNDKGGNVQAAIGKMSFAADDLVENLGHFIATIEKTKPSGVKGQYIRKITVSGAMTPGVEVYHQTAVEA